MINTPTKLLLVDDDPSILALLHRIFESYFQDSISLTCSTEPEYAERICISEEIDILFTDLNMPGLNGFNLLKRVKARNVLTQVVILSAQPTGNAIRSAFNLGANEYLTKPIVRDELIDTTKYLVGQSKRWRQYMSAELPVG